MPFSKTPSISTFQTKKLVLAAEMNSRGDTPTKDVDYLNCFLEYTKNKVTQEQDVCIRKRPGSKSITILPSANTRGVYYWEDQSKLYIAHGHDVSIYTMPNYVFITTLVNVFPTTTTGTVGIVEFLYDTGIVKLVVSDGTTLSTIDSANTVVASADPDMPVHLPNIVFLDGYLFIVKTSSADLYNSNLNDPLAYTAGDFISSEILADRVTYVTKLNNYILLFGNDSIEYFWDAGNASGSPLQRNDTPVKFTGLLGGVAQYGSKIYFVGDMDKTQPNVFVLEDFKITPLGNEQMRRFLTTSHSNMFGNILSLDGHDFYILSVTGYTFCLELETNLWNRLGYASTQSMDINYALDVNVAGTHYPVFTLYGSTVLHQFDSAFYQDVGAAILTTALLNNEEFDTYNQKYMSDLVIWADKPTSTSAVLVQWVDDDYQTFTNGISVDLYQELPRINRLGRFRRRAFKFTHTANQPLRIQAVEVRINIGQS